jgi:protein associated with RNAse G/E
MNPGDTLTIRQLHADGACYRWHTAIGERIEADCIVALVHKDTLIYQDSGNWDSPFHARMYFWPNKWMVLEENYDEHGTLKEIYININSPPTFGAGTIEYVDYELDVAKELGKPAVILDEDEFAEAIVTYGYSELHQQNCWATVQAGLALAESWHPRGWHLQ